MMVRKRFFVSGFALLIALSLVGTAFSASTLPAAYDLRSIVTLSPIRDQGAFLNCWAISCIEALETNAIKQGLLTAEEPLSPLHLAYFAFADPRPGYSYSPGYASTPLDAGGVSRVGVELFSRFAGPTAEANAPYPVTRADYAPLTGYPEDSSLYPRTISLRAAYPISYVPSNYQSEVEREETILQTKQFIMDYGAIFAGISYFSGKYLNQVKIADDRETYAYYCDSADPEAGGHSVTLIGWDDSFSRENFGTAKPSRDGAWLARNAWGSDWGDQGYFWISYAQGIVDKRVFIAEKADNTLNCYVYDEIACLSTGLGSQSFWSANVFRTSHNEILKKVGFYTQQTGIEKYNVSIYDLGTDVPSSPIAGKCIASQAGSLPYTGYHTLDLASILPLTGGHYFSVVLKVAPGVSVVAGRASDHVVNAGESYFSIDGKTWTDGTSLMISGVQNEYPVNATIKAFTTNGGDGGDNNQEVTDEGLIEEENSNDQNNDSNNGDDKGDSSGGGGCDVGFVTLSLAALIGLSLVHRRR